MSFFSSFSVKSFSPANRNTTIPKCLFAGISNLSSLKTNASNFWASLTPYIIKIRFFLKLLFLFFYLYKYFLPFGCELEVLLHHSCVWQTIIWVLGTFYSGEFANAKRWVWKLCKHYRGFVIWLESLRSYHVVDGQTFVWQRKGFHYFIMKSLNWK